MSGASTPVIDPVELTQRLIRRPSVTPVDAGAMDTLERVFEGQRAYFGPKRKNGAKKMRQGEWGGLSAMRDLQLPRVVSE